MYNIFVQNIIVIILFYFDGVCLIMVYLWHNAHVEINEMENSATFFWV